jgi:hypothetical protein
MGFVPISLYDHPEDGLGKIIVTKQPGTIVGDQHTLYSL